MRALYRASRFLSKRIHDVHVTLVFSLLVFACPFLTGIPDLTGGRVNYAVLRHPYARGTLTAQPDRSLRTRP